MYDYSEQGLWCQFLTSEDLHKQSGGQPHFNGITWPLLTPPLGKTCIEENY